MKVDVVWADAAAREYDNLPASVQKDIDSALFELAVHSRGDVKRLEGIRPPEYRLPVGDYRARFDREGQTLHVLHVLPRGRAYRKR